MLDLSFSKPLLVKGSILSNLKVDVNYLIFFCELVCLKPSALRSKCAIKHFAIPLLLSKLRHFCHLFIIFNSFLLRFTNHVLPFGTHVVFDFLLFWISLIGPRAARSVLMMTLARVETFIKLYTWISRI